MAQYYGLVLFIFLLGFLFLLAIKFLFPKKKKKTDDAKDEKLLRLYRQIEDMLDSFEEYVNEVKQELSNDRENFKVTLDEYEKKIDEKIKNLEENIKPEDDKLAAPIKKRVKSTPKSKGSKQEQVKQLYDEGVPLNDIAKQLNLTSAEIKLIIDVNN